jgi:hypothetical protein
MATDVVAQLVAANPVDRSRLCSEQLTEALARVWLTVDTEATPVSPPSRGRHWRARAAGLIASAGTTLALVLVLSAGPAPSLASTFPILAERPASAQASDVGLADPQFGEDTANDWTDSVRTAIALNELPAALRDARPFPIPASYAGPYGANAAGYVTSTPDGRRLCLAATARRWRARGTDHVTVGAPVCASTAAVERNGLVDVIRHSKAVYGGVAFIALVPPTARVTLTGNDITATVQVLGGIAVGVTFGPATLRVILAGRVERWSLV